MKLVPSGLKAEYSFESFENKKGPGLGPERPSDKSDKEKCMFRANILSRRAKKRPSVAFTTSL